MGNAPFRRMRAAFSPISLPSRSLPHAGVGVSVGCFAGCGYGLAVGVGKVKTFSPRAVLIQPTLSTPFAHDGAMVGAFCGVLAGGGFGAAVALHLGYQWHRGVKYVSKGVDEVRKMYDDKVRLVVAGMLANCNISDGGQMEANLRRRQINAEG